MFKGKAKATLQSVCGHHHGEALKLNEVDDPATPNWYIQLTLVIYSYAVDAKT